MAVGAERAADDGIQVLLRILRRQPGGVGVHQRAAVVVDAEAVEMVDEYLKEQNTNNMSFIAPTLYMITFFSALHAG